MRLLLLLTLLLLIGIRTQGQNIFRLDSLPAQGTVLDQGWQWQPGDDPGWASPNVDDRRWQPIDPTQDMTTLPQLQHTRVGWLRLHLRVDSTLLGTIISMLIDQQVASQIYLNGRLIGGFGRVSTNPDSIEAYNPAGADQALWQVTHCQLAAQTQQVLAIRFALQPGIRYVKYWGRPIPFLFISLQQANQRNQNWRTGLGNFDFVFLDYTKFGVFLILAILHLFFYRWYPAQKVNLWFGVYCLLASLAHLLLSVVYHPIHDLQQRTAIFILLTALYMATHLLFMGGVYAIFKKRIDLLFYTALAVLSIYFFLVLVKVRMPTALSVVLPLLFTDIRSTRLLLLAARKRDRIYHILSVGAVCYLLFTITYVAILYSSYELYTKTVFKYIAFNLSILVTPLSVTLFIASRFARTYRALGQKLMQVERLSAKTITQEQEKQQILTSQNETLERQVLIRTAELNRSLTELKNTQTQLVQREKMASLGEMTAGVAHELQNPLGFVANFSEISLDVLAELREAIEAHQTGEIQQLSQELGQNLSKILYHSGRTSAIIKGMMPHFRNSSGEYQLIDLNALANEQLSLAYQSYRSAHPQFVCQLLTDFDTQLNPISLMAQELGRVLLNLYTNAFYAMGQRMKQVDDLSYQAVLRVGTHWQETQVELCIQDNGIGMDESVQTKIFQPFFTTKPPGQGTGLGLSLSYDIVTKGHSGQLTVASQPGQGSVFRLLLPSDNPVSSTVR